MHIFVQPVISNHGLLTTVAFKMGVNTDPIYALEGSVSVAGSAVKWLKENLGIANHFNNREHVENVGDVDKVHFVPAFSGLYAPHWKSDARG